MKKFILVLFSVLLISVNLFAQTGGITQSGKATQEMGGIGFFAAHSSLPIGDTIRVVNTITGEEIDATVCGRIEESPDRIVDLSDEAWDVLGLMEDDIVTLVYTPPGSLSNFEAFEPQTVETMADIIEDSPVEDSPIEDIPVEIPQQKQISEIPRQGQTTTQPMYHLLILDRVKCKSNSDISNLQNIKLLYKFKHGRNGYLIAVYISSGEESPEMPDKSRVLVNLTAANKAFLRDYTNSSVFRRFVTNRRVISQLQRTLR
jgi:hypothetical protein